MQTHDKYVKARFIKHKFYVLKNLYAKYVLHKIIFYFKVVKIKLYIQKYYKNYYDFLLLCKK